MKYSKNVIFQIFGKNNNNKKNNKITKAKDLSIPKNTNLKPYLLFLVNVVIAIVRILVVEAPTHAQGLVMIYLTALFH